MTGVFIGGAMYHVPIVLDGLISGAAVTSCKAYYSWYRAFYDSISSGKRTGGKGNFKRNRDQASHPWRSALGEGTGAVMVFSLLDLAMSVYNGHTDFSRLEMAPYERLS